MGGIIVQEVSLQVNGYNKERWKCPAMKDRRIFTLCATLEHCVSRVNQEIRATIQSALGNKSNHPESTRNKSNHPECTRK